ncbi:hypothetical protein [Microbacterium sp.]|uniref:hypothetical protein n=1 Tax=Microbacterium sp. TaxID=51671 RepID=UPI001AD0935F|nr:hypothetical protein [Microbacterium sp.]MBN9156915.1 hypothetical protein [Microbacterium sp.]
MATRPVSGDGVAALEKRLRFLVVEINDFLAEVGDYRRDRLSVVAIPRIRDRNRRVAYTMRVTGEPVPDAWTEQMHNIIGRARSLLDNLMWAAAHRTPEIEFNAAQRRQIYFPLSRTPHDWTRFAESAHGRALDPEVREALRIAQPYESGNTAVRWFSKANNDDKHKAPLSLQMMPDRLFVFYPKVDFGKRGRGTSHFELADADLPIANRFFGYFESEHPITAAYPSDVATALCIQVGEDWIDVQDFLWDVLEFVIRAGETLFGRTTPLADALKHYIDQERARLDAFRRIFDGDVLAEAVWKAMRPRSTDAQSLEDALGIARPATPS